MSTKRKYADTDDSTSESDSDHSDYTDEDQENEHETDPWASLKMEAMTKNMPEFQELTETFTADGLEEEEAKDKAYLTILPKLRKDLQSIYLNRLLWIAQMKKDPIHKQIMITKDAFANDDNFDSEESLEAAVDKRKFLMKRLFGDTRSTNKYALNDFKLLEPRTHPRIGTCQIISLKSTIWTVKKEKNG